MANQELYNKTYQVPANVIKYIQATLVSNPTGEGVKRAKFITKNGVLTYQELKRLKNFFDSFNAQTGDNIQYALAGGDLMRTFIQTTLNADRHAVASGKKVKQDMTANPNSELMPYQAPRLNEDKKKELIKNAVAVIVNSDNKILLLKRADNPKGWMPNKWALCGGGIEKGETPQQAIEREIKEEIGLEIKKFVKCLSIQRKTDSVEHVFACRYEGEDTDIKLNKKENTNYGWYDFDEIDKLDTVPQLMEYIVLVFTKYE